MRSWRVVPLLLLAGCGGCKDDTIIPLVSTIDGWTPSSVEVVTTTGSLSMEVPIRLVNEYGAAVPGGEVSVQIVGDTATGPSSVLIDETGYGMLLVNASSSEIFEVLPSGSSDGASGGPGGWAYALDAMPPDLNLMPAWPGKAGEDPSFLVNLTGGLLLASGTRLWYYPTDDNLPPHEVASLHDYAIGLRTLHIDNDGLLDALFWSPSELLLLRGRPGGGLSWGQGMQASGMAILGVSGGDVNGDQLTDVALAITDGVASYISLMIGDGAWGFTADQDIPLDVTPTDVLLAHTDRDGYAEVGILDSSGYLIRYAWLQEQWTRSGVSSPNMGATQPCTFIGSADITSGGTDDVFVQGARSESEDRALIFFTTESPTTRYEETFEDFDATVGDLSGDGVSDIVLRIDGELHIFTAHNRGSAALVERNAYGFPASGLLAVGDFDADDCPDAAIADGPLRIYTGNSACNEGLSGGQIDGQWLIRDEGWELAYLGLNGPFRFSDLDHDQRDELLLAFTGESDNLALSTYSIDLKATSFSTAIDFVGAVSFGASNLASSFEECDGSYYFITDSVSGSHLIRVDLDEYNRPEITAQNDTVLGTMLACGGQGVVAVAQPDGTVTHYDQELLEIASEELGALQAFGVGDLDGDGIPEVESCNTNGCDVLIVDVDGDGIDELFRSEYGSLSSSSVNGEGPVQDGGGTLSAADINGDGLLDILAIDNDRIWIFPMLPGGAGPAMGQHTIRLEGDFLSVGNLTGDSPILGALGSDGIMLLAGSPL